MRMSVKRMRMSVAVSNWIPETSILVSGRTRVNVRGESKGGGGLFMGIMALREVPWHSPGTSVFA